MGAVDVSGQHPSAVGPSDGRDPAGPRWAFQSVTRVLSLGYRRALSASRAGTLRLWDLTTGATLRVFDGHSGESPTSCRWGMGGRSRRPTIALGCGTSLRARPAESLGRFGWCYSSWRWGTDGRSRHPMTKPFGCILATGASGASRRRFPRRHPVVPLGDGGALSPSREKGQAVGLGEGRDPAVRG